MEPSSQRRRLHKKKIDESETYRIPKKQASSSPKIHTEKPKASSPVNPENPLSDEAIFGDFITDKVEYQSEELPSSSEESAHSTDEERSSKKRKHEDSASGSEESAEDTPSEEEEPDDDVADNDESGRQLDEESQEMMQDPTRNLIGKEALAAKRASGLIPPKPHESLVKEEKHKLKKKKKHKSKSSHKEDKPHKKHKHSEDKEEEPSKPKKSHKSPAKDSKKYIQYEEFSSKEDRKKADLITRILVRWWYAFPDWPPQDVDYTAQLTEKKLRLISNDNWLMEPQLDANGLEKVREIAYYPGMFQTSKGVVYDLRDLSNAPSFNNFFAKTRAELKAILVTALKAQSAELTQQPEYDTKLARELERELTKLTGGEPQCLPYIGG